MRFSYISRYTQYISRYTIMGYFKLSRGSGFQRCGPGPTRARHACHPCQSARLTNSAHNAAGGGGPRPGRTRTDPTRRALPKTAAPSWAPGALTCPSLTRRRRARRRRPFRRGTHVTVYRPGRPPAAPLALSGRLAGCLGEL
jgi:hypothetical protein